jgi:hypothetical protein
MANPATPTTPLKNTERVTADTSLGNIVTLPEITIYGTIPKPGQSYDDADEAAVGAIFFINPKSKKEQREYAGWIYQNPKDNKFYFTNPVRGDTNDSNPGSKPQGMTAVGTYHTHGGRPKGQSVATDEVFSPQDKLKATLAKQLSYLGTPKNKVLKFTPIDLLPNQSQSQYPNGFVETLFEGD